MKTDRGGEKLQERRVDEYRVPHWSHDVTNKLRMYVELSDLLVQKLSHGALKLW